MNLFKRLFRAADVRPHKPTIRAANERLNEAVAQLDGLPPVTHPFPDGGMYGRLD